MSTQIFYDTQMTAELKKYTVDLTEFLPTSASIAGASAWYAQTFGGSTSGSMATSVTSPYVTFTTPSLTTGLWTLGASAALSDGQIRKALVIVRVDA